MTQEFLENLRLQLIQVAEAVAQFIKSELHNVSANDIEIKDLNSLVSYVDKEAEEQLVKSLTELLPDTGFITEEETSSKGVKETNWIIDPLDGTTNFLHKIPHFSISVALQHKGNIVMGLVYEIMQDTAFTAVLGGGAWENAKRISVRNLSDEKEAMVVTGFPYKRSLHLDARLEVLKQCILKYRGMRRLGSAALDLAYVASGKIDIYYENTLNIWDIAAGALLVQEAGGVVSDYSGNSDFLSNGSVIATNAHFHSGILDIIEAHLT